MLSKFIDDETVAVFPLKSVWPFVRSNKKKTSGTIHVKPFSRILTSLAAVFDRKS